MLPTRNHPLLPTYSRRGFALPHPSPSPPPSLESSWRSFIADPDELALRTRFPGLSKFQSLSRLGIFEASGLFEPRLCSSLEIVPNERRKYVDPTSRVLSGSTSPRTRSSNSFAKLRPSEEASGIPRFLLLVLNIRVTSS